ncbi:DEAD/DEAH box helicase [Roseomonas stagni]|uniref:DEAD-box ATP-dependent RNA helicase RhpA n=1 Tax=Falsiroseomonas algicola TaxID=2716930 RepID=A0A6M1LTL9_9PROT|nr:DEAD/DEAH box helicase [Falsiroseomonas algicola]
MGAADPEHKDTATAEPEAVSVVEATAAAPTEPEPAAAEPVAEAPAEEAPAPVEAEGRDDVAAQDDDRDDGDRDDDDRDDGDADDDGRDNEDDEEDLRSEAERAYDEQDPEEPARTTFADVGLSEPILRAVTEAGYLYPTPIQEAAIPIVLMGRDVLGCAQTGTGKTASFTLPMLDILAGSRAKARMPRSLILEPTRELALQVAENFVKYGKHLNLTHALLIGGESMNEQRDVLDKGVDVLIATPGRLLDLFDRGRILLADCKVLVIDEADRMLDMGFIPDVERIVSLLPRMRQTLFFSATMAPEIRRLADAFLQNPKEITVSAPATVATTITTGLVWVREMDKREALRRLLRREAVQNALIFCNRKIDVDILYKSLKRHGFSVGALHGDLDQSMRFATLNKFKANELQLLVCSDVAARGLDIGGLSHVFNFDVPFHAEDYVHRIGRTGRAGREGHAYSLAAPEDARSVAAIEKLTGKPIPRMEIDGLDPISAEEIAEGAKAKRGRGGRPAQGGRDGGRDGGRGGRDAGRDRGRDRGGRDRDRGGRDHDRGRRPPVETLETAADDVPVRDARPPRPPRRDEAPRDEAPRDRVPREGRRDDRGPRRDGRPGRDLPPREEMQSYAARREEFRRERREDREAGPSPRGFGDAVPAFMLLPLPRPKRDSAADTPAPEGSAEPGQDAEAA